MKMLKRAHCSKALSTRFEVSGVGGAAEKMNIERPTSNIEWEKMKKQTYDLEERLLEYSVRIIKIVEQLPNTRADNHVAGQLLRSGTSPYPNHGEAQAAESPKDFIHKLRISLNEIKLRSAATSLFDVQRWTFDVRCSSFKTTRNVEPPGPDLNLRCSIIQIHIWEPYTGRNMILGVAPGQAEPLNGHYFSYPRKI